MTFRLGLYEIMMPREYSRAGRGGGGGGYKQGLWGPLRLRYDASRRVLERARNFQR